MTGSEMTKKEVAEKKIEQEESKPIPPEMIEEFMSQLKNIHADIRNDVEETLKKPVPKEVDRVARRLFYANRENSALRFVKFVAEQKPDVPFKEAAINFIFDNTTRGDLVLPLARSILKAKPKYMDILPGACILADDWRGAAYYFNMIVRSNLKQHTYNTIIETANVFIDLGYYRKAHNVLKLWFELGGGVTARSSCSMGRCLESISPYEACDWYAKAIKLLPKDPIHSCNYALALFRIEEFEKGFSYYQNKNIKTLVDKAYLKIPQMKKDTDVTGKNVLLYQEQGLGDTLQFIRFLPELRKKKPKSISLTVPGTLEKILRQSYPDVTFINQKGGEEEAKKFDYALPIPFMPHMCGLKTRHDIPTAPYLKNNPRDVARFRSLLSIADDAPDKRVIKKIKPKIGLVWSGKRRLNRGDSLMDKRRSLPFDIFISAIAPVDATLVSLQFGDRQNDPQRFKGQKILNVMSCIRDMADTAALIASLDLVITVDTSVAHLAGAVANCPIWLIDRWGSCWRWGNEGEDSPWYPQVRIFRRPEKDPHAVMKEIAEELPKWVKRFTKRTSKSLVSGQKK